MKVKNKKSLIGKLRIFASVNLYIGVPFSLYRIFSSSYIQNPQYKYIDEKVFNPIGFAMGLDSLWAVIFIWLVMSALASLLEGQIKTQDF